MPNELNPYQPPNVEIAGEVGPPVMRPPLIALAYRILWIDFIVGWISLIPPIRGQWWNDPDGSIPDGTFLVMILVLMAVSIVLFLTLLYFTGRRHNWARWTLLVYLALTWYLTLVGVAETALETPLAALFDVGSFLAQVTACFLLFLSRDAAWFRNKEEPDGY